MGEDARKDWGGPYVAAAFLCEKVLNELDNVPSYVRVLDRVTVTPPVGSTQPAGSMPSFPFQCTLVVSFKSGRAKGRHDVAIQVEGPSGLREDEVVYPMLFEGEDRGVALNLQVNLILTHEGIHWFDVTIDQRLVTRVPLRVIYQPAGLVRAGASQ